MSAPDAQAAAAGWGSLGPQLRLEQLLAGALTTNAKSNGGSYDVATAIAELVDDKLTDLYRRVRAELGDELEGKLDKDDAVALEVATSAHFRSLELAAAETLEALAAHTDDAARHTDRGLT